MYISILVPVKLCTKREVDRGPALIDVLRSLGGGKGQEVHYTVIEAVKADVPAALAVAAKTCDLLSTPPTGILHLYSMISPPHSNHA